MTSTDLMPTALLARKAVVYVRQSSQSQVMTNLESQRRQYDLVDVARQRGFSDIETIDDVSDARQAERSHVPASTVLSPYYAPAKLVPFYASTPYASHVTAVTGTICSNYAASSRRAS